MFLKSLLVLSAGEFVISLGLVSYSVDLKRKSLSRFLLSPLRYLNKSRNEFSSTERVPRMPCAVMSAVQFVVQKHPRESEMWVFRKVCHVKAKQNIEVSSSNVNHRPYFTENHYSKDTLEIPMGIHGLKENLPGFRITTN